MATKLNQSLQSAGVAIVKGAKIISPPLPHTHKLYMTNNAGRTNQRTNKLKYGLILGRTRSVAKVCIIAPISSLFQYYVVNYTFQF